jgi:hypothetical protein
MRKSLVAIGVLALAGSLVVGVAIAKPKCPKECSQGFAATKKSCKLVCKDLTDKAAKKACRKACVDDFKASKLACKTAAPTFPACSPSGAFLD